VPYSASGAEITRAYRAAMKRFHPDRQAPAQRAAAEERSKLLNRAYATLSKPTRRQVYDRSIRAQVVQDQIMGRYVGGFAVPGAQESDPAARHLRRDPTAAERREQARSDRGAMVSILVLFGGVTLAVVAVLLLWAALDALVGALF
jgi:DnaJ-class molecular chaperone